MVVKKVFGFAFGTSIITYWSISLSCVASRSATPALITTMKRIRRAMMPMILSVDI